MTDENIADDIAMAERVLPVGTVLCDGQFTITGQLGAGGFGITYRAKDNVLGRTIVIKECFPEDFCIRQGKNVVARARAHEKPVDSIVRMFIREARSLAKLRHPNIVGVHRAFEENETAYMALDLIDGRDLFDILQTNAKALSPARVKHILSQMLDAVEEVHGLDLLHRDISPDNIIIERTGTPVLIDFGAAKGDASRHTRAVSSLLVVKDGYSPQEFYVAGSEQSPSSDLYALAATFYHVLSGEAPANSQARMIEMVGNKPDPCKPLLGRIPGYDNAFLAAIDQAMQVHPTDRIQSAAAWKAMIADSYAETADTTNTQGQVIKNELSLELELSLSRLVAETNDEVEKSKMIPVEPETIEVPQATNSRPEWVEEFNEESLAPEPSRRRPTSGLRLRSKASSVASDVHPSATDALNQKSQSETNWIERAAVKQDRIRSDRERELELFADTPAEQMPNSPTVLASGLGDEPLIVTAPPRSNTTPIRLLIGLLLCLCFVAYFQMPAPPELPTVNALR